MKWQIVTILIVVCASTASAEQTATQTSTPTVATANAQIHRGNIKIGVGLGLVVAGLYAANLSDARPAGSGRQVASGGMVAGGLGLIAWGARQRHQAATPETTLGVMVGQHRGLQILRRW